MMAELKKSFNLACQVAQRARLRDAVLWFVLTALHVPYRLSVLIDGRRIFVRTMTPDIRVALSCFSGEFDELISALPSLRHQFILDAGGYIGTAAIVFAEAFPDATIITLEPSQRNFEILSRNIAYYSNIIAVNKALSVEEGPLTLMDRGTGEWGLTIVDAPEDATNAVATENVNGITLDKLLCEFDQVGFGLVKLDIEGGEYALMTRNVGWLEITQAL